MLSSSSPKIMGILNVTPDSFSDGGRYNSIEKAVAQALKMVEDGADIIDVGGESTRPGSDAVSMDEECKRVLPVIERLKQVISVPLSIDTRHAKVMEAALKAGASIINDVYALQDEGALTVAAAAKVPVCVMHMQGLPKTMQNNPIYTDVLEDVYSFFEARIIACEESGILRQNIWIDPGFGFGKTLEHNLMLLGNLSFFKTLKCPILVGLSRKTMFGKMLDKPVTERLFGSLAGATLAALQDVDIIRTHDVAETKDALTIVKAIQPYWQTRTELR